MWRGRSLSYGADFISWGKRWESDVCDGAKGRSQEGALAGGRLVPMAGFALLQPPVHLGRELKLKAAPHARFDTTPVRAEWRSERCTFCSGLVGDVRCWRGGAGEGRLAGFPHSRVFPRVLLSLGPS